MTPDTGMDLRAALRTSRLRCALVTALVLALAACERPAAPESGAPKTTTDPEIAWAAAALTRNPDLELLATDAAAGVFTVRIKSSRDVRTVRLSELAAAPISQLATKPAATTAAADADKSASATQAMPAQPALATATPEPAATTAASPASNQTRSSTETANYTIDRAGGQVKVSGPGVSIVSAGTAASAPRAANETPGTDTIICEGHRMLHLDDRAINVTGNAIIARGGCELYITNSRIVAGGTAVIVQDATVHISNSTIEGHAASLDAEDRARLLIRSSTFKGVQRRSERAVFQDQGGNQWR